MKRKSAVKYFDLLRPVLSIGIAMVIVTILIFAVSEEPLTALRALMLGPLDSLRRFGNVIEMAIPLTFTGLAVCVMFKANQFNMAAEGAFFIGAVVAALIGIFTPLPPLVVTVLALLAGMVVGAVVTTIPVALKLKLGASEIVTSLMVNYILVFLGRYLLSNIMRDPASGSGSSYAFQAGVKLPVLISGTRIHAGLLIVAAVTLFTILLFRKSSTGYAIKIVGQNENFAAYTGMNVSKLILLSQVMGGAIAGVGGATEMLGIYSRFSWIGSPGYGWDGLIIAILSSQNPAFVPFAALFFAYLRIGADVMSMSSDVPAEIIAVVQAVIILLLPARAFLAKYRAKLQTKETLAQRTEEEATA